MGANRGNFRDGEIEGFARLSLMTDSLAAAVDGADVVALTVPTVSLPTYAAALAETTTPEQVIWLNPGHSGGALFLAAEFDRLATPEGPRTATGAGTGRPNGPPTAGAARPTARGLRGAG